MMSNLKFAVCVDETWEAVDLLAGSEDVEGGKPRGRRYRRR